MVFRKHGMQHDLFVMVYTACLWSVFAINTCDSTYINTLCVFYSVRSWVGLGAGVGLSAPMKVKMYIKLFIFFTNACKPSN